MTANPPTITPDDLLRMPDEGRGFELVDGRLRELNVSKPSSRVAGQIYYHIERYCVAGRPGWVFPEGTSFQCFADDPGRVRRPDTSYIALDRLTADEYQADGHCKVIPDLAVEVVSPNDLSDDVAEKRDEWLAAGVRVVWVVHPKRQTVSVYRPGGGYEFLRESDTLAAPDLLPGFAAPVADLFRIPGRQDGRP